MELFAWLIDLHVLHKYAHYYGYQGPSEFTMTAIIVGNCPIN